MIQSAVVRVYATTQRPSFERPWQYDSVENGTGSGVILGPGRILTGAHVVGDATFVQVQRISDPEKFVARIERVSHDSDLALLVVDDPGFMDGVTPAVLGGLPDFQDEVTVVGFPVGGEEVSITGGVVSRLEVQKYSHSQRKLLAVTVDAAINSGNSGGPVLDEDGLVIGIAFQSLEDAENIGELVPVPVIERFLTAIESDRPTGIPSFGVRTQPLENKTLRASLGLPEDQSGLLVQSVDWDSTCDGVVKPGDVLTSIDGHRVANNGTIRYRDRYRMSFDVLLGERQTGERLPIGVWRDGANHDLAVELKPHRPTVRDHCHDIVPPWFVFGGLVFLPLSLDYLRTWGRSWWESAPTALMAADQQDLRREDRREIVVLSSVLADEINLGYSAFENEPVTHVNGQGVRDLEHLVEIVDAAAGSVEFRMALGGRLVFDAATARAAHEAILHRYKLPGDRSEKLHFVKSR